MFVGASAVPICMRVNSFSGLQALHCMPCRIGNSETHVPSPLLYKKVREEVVGCNAALSADRMNTSLEGAITDLLVGLTAFLNVILQGVASTTVTIVPLHPPTHTHMQTRTCARTATLRLIQIIGGAESFS